MLDTDFWKKYFKVYDVLNLLIPYQELLKSICDALKVKSGDRILEAGCGTCNLVLKLKERGGEVVGLDFSQAALEVCREKDEKLELVHSNLVEKLPFEDNSFDKISCNNVLYAIPEEKHDFVLQEFKRVLKPGGRLAMANPKRGWSPLKIYITGIKLNFKREGFFKTLIKLFSLLGPAVKILYYNRFITQETEYYFFEKGEQEKLLKENGFSGVSEGELVYAGQAILVRGVLKHENLQ